MTPELASAYHDQRPPFDGVTLVADNLGPEDLWRGYRAAARCLSRTDRLWQCADWHWHDGFITPAKALAWDEFCEWLESPERLVAAWETEDHVHRAVFPDDFRWLLRFYLWEFPGPDDKLGFDVSGPSELIEAVRQAVGLENVRVENSIEWFAASGWTWTS